jgi:hypothetical protein
MITAVSMRHFGIVFFMACVACRKERSEAAPTTVRVVHCQSSDGKYRVDLSLHGMEAHPRTARVLVDDRDAGAGEATGVAFGGGFPPPGALTCRKSDDPSNTGCYVANTADYGYIANVHLEKQGKRTIELRQNGLGSTYLATLGCDP